MAWVRSEKTAQKIIELAKRGLDRKTIATVLDKTPRTIREYQKNAPDVAAAFTEENLLTDIQKPKIKITDEVLNQIETYATSGRPLKEIARALGITETTLRGYRAKDARIDEAYERGQEKAHIKVGVSLFKNAAAGSISHIRWYEMTRIGYAEKTENKTETTEVPYVVELPPDLDSEEWKKEYGQE